MSPTAVKVTGLKAMVVVVLGVRLVGVTTFCFGDPETPSVTATTTTTSKTTMTPATPALRSR
jgi:hypothetical protein